MAKCKMVCAERAYKKQNIHYSKEAWCGLCMAAIPRMDIYYNTKGFPRCPCCHCILRLKARRKKIDPKRFDV